LRICPNNTTYFYIIILLVKKEEEDGFLARIRVLFSSFFEEKRDPMQGKYN